MNGKSPDAFRTISEVADWLGVNTHVLRFWESKFTQVKPIKRAGGRRYYRPADMELLGGIQKLLHDEGMTIKGVQKILRDQGVRAVSAMSKPVDPPEEISAAPEAPEEMETVAAVAEEAPTQALPGEVATPEAPVESAPIDRIEAHTEAPVEPDATPVRADALHPETAESAPPPAEPDELVAEPPQDEIEAVSDIEPTESAAAARAEQAVEAETPPEIAVSPIPEALEDTTVAELETVAEEPAPVTPPEPAPEPEAPQMPLFSRRMVATNQEPPATLPVPETESALTHGAGSPAAPPAGPIIAPLPPAAISLTEALERLQPMQVSPAQLAPIHAQLIALRERMDAAR